MDEEDTTSNLLVVYVYTRKVRGTHDIYKYVYYKFWHSVRY